jgi:carboxypeptidase T
MRLGVAAVAFPGLVLAGLVPAASASPVPHGAESEAIVQFQIQPVGTTMDAVAQELLADGYDVYGGHDGVLFVHAPASAQDDLAAYASVEVLAENTVMVDFDALAPESQDDILPERLDGAKYETFYGGYRTTDAYLKFAKDLQKKYPELVKAMTFGETEASGRDLRVVCVTAGANKGCKTKPDVDKARFVLMAQIHARELSTSELTWRLLTLLTDKYGKDADITSLLDETEIWVIPQVNPDGIETVQDAFQGEGGNQWHRKNMHKEDDCGATSGNHIGTDVNRNFDSNWGGPGTSGVPCAETYRGASAASEAETQGMQGLFKDVFEDQRGSDPDEPAPQDTRGTFVSLHSYSNLVLFPYGDSRHTPNDAGLRSMGFRMSHYNGYETGEPDEILYQVSGSTDDYAYEKLGVAAFTYEIGPGSGTCSGFFPAYSCQDGFWDLNRDALLYAARAAQKPYEMGMGPTVVNAKSKSKGGKVLISATADDDAYGNIGVGRPTAQNVTDARVFVGKAPWDGGKAKAMKIKGSGSEVDAKVKVKSGKKAQLAWIQAKDKSGNWGPTYAVWVPKKG